jgi:phosphoribosylamine---glycine ligase
MVRGDLAKLAVRPGYSVGIVLTTPPFPYTREDVEEAVGLPVILTGTAGPGDDANTHYGEVGLNRGQLVTSGKYGWTMVVTGVGPTVREARQEAYCLADRVFVPNLRFRRDIGELLIARDLARVEALGLLSE